MNDLIERYLLNKVDEEVTEEVVTEDEVNIDDIPDELIEECIRAAEHDVSLICEETEEALDELDDMVKEGATLNEDEMKEDLVSITSEEDYEALVDAYTLTLLTGNDEYLEEACLELQKVEDSE